MTAIRKSIVFGFEDEFGMGLGKDQHWYYPPPGSFISHQHNRSTNRVRATGSKKFDFYAYGKYSGTWDWSFYLDYEYLEPLKLMFEKETFTDEITYDFNKFDLARKNMNVLHMAIRTKEGQLPDPAYLPEEYRPYIIIKLGTTNNGETTYTYYRYSSTANEGAGSFVEISGLTVENEDIVPYLYLDDDTLKLCVKRASIENSTLVTWDPSTMYIDLGAGEYAIPPAANCAYLITNDSMTIDGTSAEPSAGETTENVISLKKVNEGRIPSMVVRIVTLNRMAGGDLDEIIEIRGCVCKTMRFSNNAGSSQWGVSLSGFCAREVMWLGKLAHNDYRKTQGELVQFACLFTGLETSKGNYVANCNALQLSFDNSAEVIDSTCTPYSPMYFEQSTEYQLTATVYSNNPILFKQRLYAGGQALQDIPNYTTDVPGYTYTWADNQKVEYLSMPLCKKLAPAKTLSIVSYDACRNDPHISDQSEDDLMDAINIAKNRIKFNIYDAVIKSMSWQRGDGEKIMDSISSTECWEINMSIKLDGRTQIENEDNWAYPIGPKFDNKTKKWYDADGETEANMDKVWDHSAFDPEFQSSQTSP